MDEHRCRHDTMMSNNSSFSEVNRRISMALISPLPSPKYAPLQLTYKLDNHLQFSLMDTYQSPEETTRCLQYKSPPPHSGRPMVQLRHAHNNSYPQSTTNPIDNNSQTTHKCPRTPPPWADQIVKDTHMSLSDAVTATRDKPSWRSLVPSYATLRVLRRKQPTQVSKVLLAELSLYVFVRYHFLPDPRQLHFCMPF